jgi:hypothetical protein
MDALHRSLTLALAVIATLAAAALALPTAGSAASVAHTDAQGRSINFNVAAPGANPAAYADILRSAAHGDEISTVTITISTEAAVSRRCGATAEACYLWTRDSDGLRSGEIVIPVWPKDLAREVLLHEYAHHLDASSVVQAGAQVFDGTPRWFQARSMAAHIAAGRVAWMYSAGWQRTIGEIFAEDYVVLHEGSGGRHRIDWLGRPGAGVLSAMASDLGVPAPSARTDERAAAARSLNRRIRQRAYRGVVRRNARRVLRAPRTRGAKRIVVSGRLRGARAARAVVRIRCGSRTVARARRAAGSSLRISKAIPAGRCRVIVAARGGAVKYRLRVRTR